MSTIPTSGEQPPPYSPVPNAAAFFPRPHPSAESVAWLGLASLLFLGPLAGIPAILLGALVQRELAAAGERYTGEDRAKLGVMTGWAGTFAFGFFYLYFAAATSESLALMVLATGVLGGLAIAVGQLVPGAPKPLVSLSDLARRSRLIVGLAVVGLMVVGAGGFLRKRSADQEVRNAAEIQCAGERQKADSAIAGGQFDVARRNFGAARDFCIGDALEAVVVLEAGLGERQAAHAKKLAAEEAAREAKLAEEKEAKAAAEFPSSAEAVLRSIRQATAKVAQRKWEVAASDLDSAEATLNKFRGTRVARDQPWGGLDDQIHALRRRIEPGLKQLQQAKEHQLAVIEAAKQEQEEARQKAQEAAEAARDREASRNLVCRDGTTSGCLCAGSHRGCCSHHGGVAGCE